MASGGTALVRAAPGAIGSTNDAVRRHPPRGRSAKKDASPPTSPTGRPVIGGTPKVEVKLASPSRPVICGIPKKVAEPPPTGAGSKSAGSKRRRKKKSTTDPSTDD